MTTGQRINKCRKAKKLSQEYIALMLGVTRQAVSKWENDLSIPDTENYINLAKLFGVSVEYLAFGTEDASTSESNQKCENESYEPDKKESENKMEELILFIGFLLILAGLVTIVYGLIFVNSLLLFFVGALFILLAKKLLLD